MLFNLGEVAVDRGDLEQAAEFLAESVDIARSLGDKIMLGGATALSGIVAVERGDLARAGALLTEALALMYKLNHRVDVAFVMEALVRAAVDGGDARRALYVAGAAARLREEIGAKLTDREAATYDEVLARARASLAAEEADRAFSEGGADPLRRVVHSLLGERVGFTNLQLFAPGRGEAC
jgi:ATP/maltotriose-dependent transcriptional regulator MalT